LTNDPEKVRVNEVRMVPGEFHTHTLLCPQCRKKFKAMRAEGPEYDAWRAERNLPPPEPTPICPRCSIQNRLEEGWRWVRRTTKKSGKKYWDFVEPDHPDAPLGLDHIPGPDDE
jgi:hypothetical protein